MVSLEIYNQVFHPWERLMGSFYEKHRTSLCKTCLRLSQISGIHHIVRGNNTLGMTNAPEVSTLRTLMQVPEPSGQRKEHTHGFQHRNPSLYI